MSPVSRWAISNKLGGFALLLGCAWSGGALAHSFGRLYNLPVPVWMYLYGAAAALAFSFLIIAWFATSDTEHAVGAPRELGDTAIARGIRAIRLPAVLRLLSVCGLLLSIATGLWGSLNPYANFSMTWFWVLFVLGLSYVIALFGNLYPLLNPWRGLVQAVGWLWQRYPQGLIAYPARLRSWPALLLYMLFIWLELHAELGPRGLGWLLLGYTALNLLGVGLVGAKAWFRHCEFFSVFFHLIGRMAAWQYGPGNRIQLRAPFAELVNKNAVDLSLLVFILFMLSSTAYDGLRATTPWAKLFWVDFYQLVRAWAGDDPMAAYHRMKPLHSLWSAASLLLSPVLYLAVYLAFMAIMRRLTRSPLSTLELGLRFGASLLPIALVYHVAHYYTLLLSQGIKIIGLISDPFGWRWNLFGTTDWLRISWLPDPAVIWHSQLALIVGGHIVSVYIAHLVACELFQSRRLAALSQLPMLGLMMLFTAGGLWILAQPIAGP